MITQTIEADGDQLLVDRRGQRAMPEELRPRVDEALATARLFER